MLLLDETSPQSLNRLNYNFKNFVSCKSLLSLTFMACVKMSKQNSKLCSLCISFFFFCFTNQINSTQTENFITSSLMCSIYCQILKGKVKSNQTKKEAQSNNMTQFLSKESNVVGIEKKI